MTKLQADPRHVERLRALAGTPFTVLGAISLCEADLFTNAWLCALTGRKTKAVSEAVASLIVMAIVEQVERYTYRLTPFGRQLVPPLAGLLTRIKDESLPDGQQLALPASRLKGESDITTRLKDDSGPAPDQPLTSELPGNLLDSPLRRLEPPSSSSLIDIDNSIHTDDDGVFRNLLEALREAGAHPQSRIPLARALLAEDGPGWLRQVLGWIAYLAREGETTPRKRGSTIYPAIKARERVPDDAFLPPPGLPFEQALAWAEAGGMHADIPPTVADADPPGPPAPTGPAHPDAWLWNAALGQLQLEIPKSTFDTWVRATTLRARVGDAFEIAVSNAYAKDWLENRLHGTVVRTLNGIVGRAVTITFTCPTDDPPQEGASNA